MLRRTLLLSSVLASVGAITACGDDDSARKLPDAAVTEIDAAPAPDAATSGVVTLTITQDGAPRAAVDVYFQAADGTLVAKVPTDASGVASATMEPGGYVTAIGPFDVVEGPFEVKTFAGVKPGDQLRLDQDWRFTAPITVTVTVPFDETALYYDVYTPCSGRSQLTSAGSGAAPSSPISLYGCGATTDLLIRTQDFNGQPLGSIYKPGVALADGGAITITDAYAAEPAASIAMTGATGFSSAFGEYRQVTGAGMLASSTFSFDLSSGAGMTAGARPVIAGALGVVSATLSPYANVGEQTVIQWGPDSASPSIDVTGALLPEYMTIPALTASTRTLAWTAIPSTATPDLAIARIDLSRVDLLTDTTRYWSWELVAPYDGTSLTLPPLPGDAATYNVIDGDGVNPSELLTARVPGGYDAVRAAALDDGGPLAGGPLAGQASGQIVLEALRTSPPVRTAPRPRRWAGPASLRAPR